MRLIATLFQQQKANSLKALLDEKKIAHRLEVALNRDWGSELYGTYAFEFWIVDEENLEAAKECVEQFKDYAKEEPLGNRLQGSLQGTLPNVLPLQGAVGMKHAYPISYILLFLCCALFFIDQQQPKPSFFSPIEKELLFDYPSVFEQIDQLPKLPREQLKQRAAYLLHTTPHWQGMIETFALNPDSAAAAPLFEKIRSGEIWRLFTPALLHANLLHLLFNMTWLLAIGRQIEKRISPLHYLLFLMSSALLTNVAQYLMSGFKFVGFSGIALALVGFVMARQQTAPWEAYQFDRQNRFLVLSFLALSVLIEAVFFLLPLVSSISIEGPIANTAHLSGIAFGYLVGKKYAS
ncbi:MAG: hypothetical protein K0S07_603 [Chlamydiales bacterium]|jgi:GlpG protein|nr:hypothetical protein [Chlamydiales bacterium]